MNSKDSVKKQKNKKRRNPFRFFFFDFVKITGALQAAIWLRPKRLYESKKAKKHVKGGAMVIANHSSYRDPIGMLFAFWYRRVYTVATQDLFNKKSGNWFFRKILCIPVNKQNVSTETFHTVVDVLKEGRIVGIFPEGCVNDDNSTVKTFKSGAVLMAMKGNVPIIPIYVAPPRKWYSRLVYVIGEPIRLEDICEGVPTLKNIDEISEKLRLKELELMEIYEKWKTRKSSK